MGEEENDFSKLGHCILLKGVLGHEMNTALGVRLVVFAPVFSTYCVALGRLNFPYNRS